MASYLGAKAAAARAEAGVSEAVLETAEAAMSEELAMLFATPRVSAADAVARVSSNSTAATRISSGSMVRPDSATPRAAAVAALVQGAVAAVLARPSNCTPLGTAVAEEAGDGEQDKVLME